MDDTLQHAVSMITLELHWLKDSCDEVRAHALQV